MPHPQGLPWGGLLQRPSADLETLSSAESFQDSKAQLINRTLHGLCHTSSTAHQSSQLIALHPGELVPSRGSESHVQQRDEAAKQNSMPLIKTAAAKLQSRGGEHDHKNQHFKVILLYFESKIVQWHVY